MVSSHAPAIKCSQSVHQSHLAPGYLYVYLYVYAEYVAKSMLGRSFWFRSICCSSIRWFCRPVCDPLFLLRYVQSVILCCGPPGSPPHAVITQSILPPLLPKLVHRLSNPRLLDPFPPPTTLLTQHSLSSGSTSLYLLTLPASLASSSSQWNLVRLDDGGRMQSGTSLIKKPRTPLDAASIAAYSRRLVESDVQY